MVDTSRVLALYGRGLVWVGLALAAIALLVDLRWIEQPIPTLLILVAVAALRASPVRLSKYSYLTQHGVPVLVGILVAVPSQVVAGMVAGVYLVDTLWLRKPLRAGLVNAGRENIAFIAAFGIFSAVWKLSGSPGVGLDFLPAPSPWPARISSSRVRCSISRSSSATSWRARSGSSSCATRWWPTS